MNKEMCSETSLSLLCLPIQSRFRAMRLVLPARPHEEICRQSGVGAGAGCAAGAAHMIHFSVSYDTRFCHMTHCLCSSAEAASYFLNFSGVSYEPVFGVIWGTRFFPRIGRSERV